jgi:hypothetical protein
MPILIFTASYVIHNTTGKNQGVIIMPMTEEEHLELMHQTGITAISVASIIEGELTQPRELGIRKIVFGAASLSKPVFAYLVLTLIEANKANKGELKLGKFIHLPPHLSEFNLNTPLSRILAPEARYCNDKKTKAYAKKLTAKLILSHQTGLPINPKSHSALLLNPAKNLGIQVYLFFIYNKLLRN